MADYVALLEGDGGSGHDGYESGSLWHVDDKAVIANEQNALLQVINAPTAHTTGPGASWDMYGFCICQSRHTDLWKRYHCELSGSELVIKKPSKIGGAPVEKSRSKVRFVTFNPLTTQEKEHITQNKMTTSCDMRIRVYVEGRTRVMVPASAEEFENWHSAFKTLMEESLDAEDYERRSEAAKEVEPLFQQMIEYEQKKSKMLLGALAQQGFMEYEKKNCIKQGVLKMRDDFGNYKKYFLLLKPHAIAYHQSGKSHRKGFITLKLARLERSEASERYIKLITPMCAYKLKCKHKVAADDWMAALSAAIAGKKTYASSSVIVDELDQQDFVPYGKPFLAVSGGKRYKLKGKTITIGRSSVCDLVVADKKISREHLKLEYVGPSKWLALDMGSNSGTHLNGKKMKQSYLKPGDVLKLGDTKITFKAKKE